MFAFILICFAAAAALMVDERDSEDSEAGALCLSILTIFVVGSLLGALFVTIK